jgi:protein-disulfide isomerase
LTPYRRPLALVALILAVLLLAACGPRDETAATDQSTYNGVPVGLTAEGFPYMGSTDAPVTVEEYTDYVCPFCLRHVTEVEPALIEQYIATGQVLLVFRDNPIPSLHPTSQQGHIASACVARQGAALFWAMHDRLFAEQATWGAGADPTAYLLALAEEVGADVDEYQACVENGDAEAVVNQGMSDAAAYGYNGTPMFRVTHTGQDDAYTIEGAQALETFQSNLDTYIAGDTPEITPTTEPESDLPFWASEDGLVVDPDRAGYTLAGDPYKGEPGAPLAVVEFSDYQCPVCRTHALEVAPALDEAFVASGKVLWVFKNLPLRIHEQAALAAAASECAGDQGQFWQMHDLLFDRVEQWSVEDPVPQFEALAAEMGLDPAAFATCIAGRDAMERVVADLYDAQDVSNSTPLFVVLYGGNGRLINGSLGVDEFTAALDEMYAEATGAEPTAEPDAEATAEPTTAPTTAP